MKHILILHILNSDQATIHVTSTRHPGVTTPCHRF